MKKLITITSVLALAGGVSFAMEEDAMDKDMMMEAPAPSVAIGGSAEIGIKNVDDSEKPNAESVSLTRAYKVTFDSSGTTDGGLLFGAGISIRDDTGEENEPVVKGSKAYIGSSDGSWKVQFGGNDPGIEQAGGIGVADDNFGGGDDASIGLYGTFEGATFRFTMANPNISMPKRDKSRNSNNVTYTEYDAYDFSKVLGADTNVTATITQDTIDAFKGVDLTTIQEVAKNCGVMVSDQADETNDNHGVIDTDDTFVAATIPAPTENNANATTPSLDRCSPYALDLNDTVNVEYEVVDNHEEYYGAKAKDNDWSLGFSYSLDTIDIGVGMDSEKGLALGLGTEFSGVGVNLYYSKSEVNDAYLGRVLKPGSNDILRRDADRTDPVDFTDDSDGYRVYNTNGSIEDHMGTKENTGIGVKASMAAGEGATFSVAYSTNKLEQSNNAKDEKRFTGSAKTKLIEIDFEYALGGGATLKAGIDKQDSESIGMGDAEGGSINSSDKTTLSASIAMSF